MHLCLNSVGTCNIMSRKDLYNCTRNYFHRIRFLYQYEMSLYCVSVFSVLPSSSVTSNNAAPSLNKCSWCIGSTLTAAAITPLPPHRSQHPSIRRSPFFLPSSLPWRLLLLAPRRDLQIARRPDPTTRPLQNFSACDIAARPHAGRKLSCSELATYSQTDRDREIYLSEIFSSSSFLDLPADLPLLAELLAWL